MSATEKALEVSLPSSEFEHQRMMSTVSNDYKERNSPKSSLSEFSQNTIPFTEFKNSLHGSCASLDDEMEVQEASSSAPLTLIQDSKTWQ